MRDFKIATLEIEKRMTFNTSVADNENQSHQIGNEKFGMAWLKSNRHTIFQIYFFS